MKTLLFWLLGVSIPFAIRTTVIIDTIREVQNPFITVYLYASDLILIVLSLFLMYEYFVSQRYRQAVPHWVLGIVAGGIWSVWVSDYPLISYLSLMRILMLIYVCKYAHSKICLPWLWKGFVVAMSAQLGIALVQFVSQSSLDFPLVVEPVLDASLAGVAKVEILGNTLVRATGTFPHPNILAFAILLWLWHIASKYVPLRLQSVWKAVLGFGLLFVAQLDHYFLTSVQGMLLGGLGILSLGIEPLSTSGSHNLFRDSLASFFLMLVLVCTFSKTAWVLALGGGLILLTLHRRPAMFHVEHFEALSVQRRIQATLCVLILGFWSVIGLAFLPTAQNRLFYIRQTWIQVVESGGMGVGLGRYVAHLPLDLPFWRYQPVHSIPLLILAEVGFGVIIGLVLYAMIRYTERYEKRQFTDKLSDR